MRKDVQEALESAIAEFEKRQQAKQERLRERERFETDWARIRTAVVVPALEEVEVLLRKVGWNVRACRAVSLALRSLRSERWAFCLASGSSAEKLELLAR
jgi:hypothetical protein